MIERSTEDMSIELEVQYNHYGDRGVVDLVVEHESPTNILEIIELKSDSAIESATGANEIIRQFKSHKKYFFKGSDYTKRGCKHIFILGFAATEKALSHLFENKALYRNLSSKERVSIYAYHPDIQIRARPLVEDARTGGWVGQGRFAEELDHIDVPSEGAI